MLSEYAVGHSLERGWYRMRRLRFLVLFFIIFLIMFYIAPKAC